MISHRLISIRPVITKMRAARFTKWNVALSAVLLLCLLVMTFVRIGAANRKKLLLALSQSLADLDLRKP